MTEYLNENDIFILNAILNTIKMDVICFNLLSNVTGEGKIKISCL